MSDWGSQLKRKLEAEGRIPCAAPKRAPRGTLVERLEKITHSREPDVHLARVFDCTLFGAPRTKKNSLKRKKIGRRLLSVCSDAFKAFQDDCLEQLKHANMPAPIDFAVNLRATVYRKQASGDLIGYLQGVCDILQKATVLVDDKWIVSFDGCRLSKDARNPRVELVLERIVIL